MPSSGAMSASSASVEKKAMLRVSGVEYTRGPRTGCGRRAGSVVNKGNLVSSNGDEWTPTCVVYHAREVGQCVLSGKSSRWVRMIQS